MKNKGRNLSTINSVGTRGMFHGQEFLSTTKDKRNTKPEHSKRGITICPVCKASVAIKLATAEECGKYGAVPDIKKGDPIIGNHRVGGGRYSVMRGDALCMGVLLPIEEN